MKSSASQSVESEQGAPVALAYRPAPQLPLKTQRTKDSLLRGIISCLILLFGFELWLVVGEGLYGTSWQLHLMLAALAACLLPPIYLPISRLLKSLESPSRRWRWLIAGLLAITAGIYFWYTAASSGVDFLPNWHDEFSYLIQSQMMAHGHLWMKQHPLADFFDSLYLITRPVYASMYFPGAALMYMPAVWLHLPTFVLPMTVCAAAVGMTYIVVTEIIDGVAGVLAALLLASLDQFQLLSHLVLSNQVMLLLWLMMIWAWLHWRKECRLRWIAVLGALAGWSLITRPLDAICLIAPLAIAVLIDLRRLRKQPAPDATALPRRRAYGRQIIIALVAAVPFLSLQIIDNVGITGHWYETPHALFDRLELPGAQYGFHNVDPKTLPQSKIVENQLFYRVFQYRQIQEHQSASLPRIISDRFWILLATDLPVTLLIIFIPLSAAGFYWASGRARTALWAIVAPLPVYLVAYSFYLGFLNTYALVVAPAMIVPVVFGAKTLADNASFGSHHLRALLRTLTVVMFIVIAIEFLPQFNPDHANPFVIDPLQTRAFKDIEALKKKPAVVLFRYHEGVNPAFSPVYNWTVKWPDEALVVRAHDLGPRNIEIFRYYAKWQPQREFYRLDESNDPQEFRITDLGNARELAEHPTAFSVEELPPIDVFSQSAIGNRFVGGKVK